MKKRASILIVCLLLLPGLTKAEKFGIKLSGGMSYLVVGDVNNGIKGSIDFWEYLASLTPDISVEGEAKPIHPCYGLEGDIIINLTHKFGIGLGVGYIYGARASKITARSPGGYENSWDNKAKISAIPVRVGVFYTLPVNEMMNAVFNAGAGLYFAKYAYKQTSPLIGGGTIDQTASAIDFGLHGGMGFEFNLAPNIALVLEAHGKYAKIGGFKGKSKHSGSVLPYEEEGNLYYWELISPFGKYPQVFVQENEPSGFGVSNVRKAKVDFSGFNFLAGIKINF